LTPEDFIQESPVKPPTTPKKRRVLSQWEHERNQAKWLSDKQNREEEAAYRQWLRETGTKEGNFLHGDVGPRYRFKMSGRSPRANRIAAVEARDAAYIAAEKAKIEAALARKGWTIGDLSGVWAAVVCVAVWFVTGMVADAMWDGAGWLGVLPAAYWAWAWNKDHEYVKGLRRHLAELSSPERSSVDSGDPKQAAKATEAAAQARRDEAVRAQIRRETAEAAQARREAREAREAAEAAKAAKAAETAEAQAAELYVLDAFLKEQDRMRDPAPTWTCPEHHKFIVRISLRDLPYRACPDCGLYEEGVR
jgi:hypothetical protein